MSSSTDIDGLIKRFLIVSPKIRHAHFQEAIVLSSDEEDHLGLLFAEVRKCFERHAGEDDDDEASAAAADEVDSNARKQVTYYQTLKFDDETRTKYIEYYNWIADEKNRLESSLGFRCAEESSLLSKCRDTTLRLAGIFSPADICCERIRQGGREGIQFEDVSVVKGKYVSLAIKFVNAMFESRKILLGWNQPVMFPSRSAATDWHASAMKQLQKHILLNPRKIFDTTRLVARETKQDSALVKEAFQALVDKKLLAMKLRKSRNSSNKISVYRKLKFEEYEFQGLIESISQLGIARYLQRSMDEEQRIAERPGRV